MFSNQKESIKEMTETQIISGIISKADTLAGTNIQAFGILGYWSDKLKSQPTSNFPDM